jgi:hypothetical protein
VQGNCGVSYCRWTPPPGMQDFKPKCSLKMKSSWAGIFDAKFCDPADNWLATYKWKYIHFKIWIFQLSLADMLIFLLPIPSYCTTHTIPHQSYFPTYYIHSNLNISVPIDIHTVQYYHSYSYHSYRDSHGNSAHQYCTPLSFQLRL